jgi:hypothetical protein
MGNVAATHATRRVMPPTPLIDTLFHLVYLDPRGTVTTLIHKFEWIPITSNFLKRTFCSPVIGLGDTLNVPPKIDACSEAHLCYLSISRSLLNCCGALGPWRFGPLPIVAFCVWMNFSYNVPCDTSGADLA